jgi:hypothetical protein
MTTSGPSQRSSTPPTQTSCSSSLDRSSPVIRHSVLEAMLIHLYPSLTIRDGFQKATYHLLILPRLPFPLPDGSTLGTEPLDSLQSFLRLEPSLALAILDSLEEAAKVAEAITKKQMRDERGWEWETFYGFHAVQSQSSFDSERVQINSTTAKNRIMVVSLRLDICTFTSSPKISSLLRSGTSSTTTRSSLKLASSSLLGLSECG